MNIARLPLVTLLTVAACHGQRPPVSVAATGAPITIASDRGPLVGRERGEMREFFGVPYAAPPVGALRWRPPAPVAAWSAPRDASRAGHGCIQLVDGKRDRDSDEDCLTLNVWSPRSDGKLPVLVWIHGGAFVQGSGNDDLIDGGKLATRAHAVVVTLNYRLGALGFMAHRALAAEAGSAASPSYGILDQRAALEWVQRNVAAFGGDPANVTIFGESAGAWSTCVHYVAPKSRGLFARAIMESGACSNALYFSSREAEQQGDLLASKVGCGGKGKETLDCLRGKSPETIVSALPTKRGMILTPGIWWGPVVDGVELPAQPLDMMRAGDFAKVPLLIGANRDEGTLHTISFKSNTPADVESFVRDNFGDEAARIVPQKYARATPKDALTDIVTDGIFVCQARRVARVLAHADVPVYLYHFTHPLDDPRVHDLGATHSIEMFFLFGNTSLGYGLSPAEQPLSRTIMDAWGAFARAGDPSTSTLAWPRYTLERDEHMTLDTASATGNNLKHDLCDFWDALDHRPGS